MNRVVLVVAVVQPNHGTPIPDVGALQLNIALMDAQGDAQARK